MGISLASDLSIVCAEQVCLEVLPTTPTEEDICVQLVHQADYESSNRKAPMKGAPVLAASCKAASTHHRDREFKKRVIMNTHVHGLQLCTDMQLVTELCEAASV